MSKQRKSRIKRIGILLTMAMVFAMVLGPATPAAAVTPLTVDPNATPSTIDRGNSSLLTAGINKLFNVTAQWHEGAQDGPQISTDRIITVSPDATTTYWVKAEWSGQTVWGSVTVTVNDPDPVTVDPNATPSTITGGDISLLTAGINKLDATAEWHEGAQDGTLISSNRMVTVTPAVTTTYWVKATWSSQEVWGSVTVTVTAPDPLTVSPDATPSTIARGWTSILTPHPSIDTATVEWHEGAQDGPVISGRIVTVKPDVTTPYWVKAEWSGQTVWHSVIVEVVDPMTLTASADLDKIVVGGSSILTAETNKGFCIIEWHKNTQDGDIVGLGGGLSHSITVSPDTTTTYWVKATWLLNRQKEWAQITVEVYDPLAVDAGNDQTIISGFSATLTAAPTGGYGAISYLWSNGDTMASTTVSPLADTTYSVEVTDSLNNKATDDVTVTVRPRPAEVWVDVTYDGPDNDGGHEWGYDAYDNIDKAIDVVASGGTIHIASGDYDFKDDGVTPQRYILIDKTVTIEGQGPSTVLSNNDGSGYHGFFINAENVTIKDLTFKDFCYGSGSVGHGTAIFVGDNMSSPHDYTYTCSGLRIENVAFDNVGYGFVARGVYDLNGSIDGAPSWTGVDNAATSSGITIEGCSFSNINYKATYFEKGSGITINNCSFDTVGLGYKTGSAIDVNLKAGDYAGVEITNNTFDNCGSNVLGYAYTSSFAVTVKARGTGNDRADYKLHPASIDSITITGNVFTGSNTYDLALGEPGKEILLCGKADETDYDITVSGNDFTSPIINYCELNQMLLLVYGDNTGIDDRANRIENPGYIKFLCNVSFDSQGGSAVPDMTAIEDFTFSRPSTPTKAGHHLDGWYKERGCVNEWDFAADTAIPNLTLYAKWNINTYTVTFDSQGGSAVGSVTADYGTVISKPADPVKDGYTFGGWYMDKECTDAWDFASHDVKSDTTLYAKWTENLPVGRLFVLGGTGTSPSPSPSATPEPTPTPTPEVIEDETPPAGSPSPSGEELGDGNVPAGGASVKGGGSIFASWWFWLLAAGGAVGLLLFLLWIFGKKGKAGMQH